MQIQKTRNPDNNYKIFPLGITHYVFESINIELSKTFVLKKKKRSLYVNMRNFSSRTSGVSIRYVRVRQIIR